MILQKWKNAKISVQGVDHIEKNTPCQDAVYTLKQKGVTAMALSDGAGSRKYSDIGSKILTQKVCELLTENFQRYLQISESQSHESSKKAYPSLRDEMYQALYDAVADYAHNHADVKVEDMAATLLFFAFHNGVYIMGHIGDGVIVGLHSGMRSDYVDVLSTPDNGDQPNITFFLTEPDGKEHFRLSIGKLNTLKGILLMSDGPEDVFYDKHKGLHENTLKVFLNYQNVSQDEYEKVLETLLISHVAKYSFDDLSFNLFYLEQNILESIDRLYARNLFSDIVSKKQIIKRSRNSVFLDASILTQGKDFDDVDALLEFLREV